MTVAEQRTGPGSVGTAERVLVCAAASRDGELTAEILQEAGFECSVCASTDGFFSEVADGAGLLLLAEEVLDESAMVRLMEVLDDQPVWSDLPLLVLIRGDARIQELVDRLGPVASVTLLERPVRTATMVSAVRAGVRARRRQYEVRDLLDRLEESDRRKDEFLAMLGHELRNPLGAISTAVELVDLDVVDADSRHRQTSLIRRQLRHLTRMVDDLLDLSRLSRGKIDLQAERVDLVEVVRQAVETLELAGKSGDRQIRLELPDEPVPVKGDPVRLEQAVSNLVRNALKFSPPEGRVDVWAGREEDRAAVRIEDEGVGIPPEKLDTIFEPFAQTDPRKAKTEGGLGVGLYLTRRLVELHGGTVEARSEGSGAGAEFVISLPVAEGEAPAAEDAADSRDHASGNGAGTSLEGLSVLLVEDNAGAREALEQLLGVWGCEVTAAGDGTHAVECGVAARPDVALIDIQLPDFDGYEVAGRLRDELGEECGTLVALTGFGQPEDRRQALESGFDDHLVKPVDPKKLSKLLARYGAAAGDPGSAGAPPHEPSSPQARATK